MPAVISSWRGDQFPQLTAKVYATSLTSQEDKLLINRGMFPLENLAGPNGDPLKTAIQGQVFTWGGAEIYGSTVETRLSPTGRRPRVTVTNPGTVTYQAIERGIEYEVAARLERDRQYPISLEVHSAVRARATLQVQREYRIADLLRTSGNSSTMAAAGFSKIDAVTDVVSLFHDLMDYVEDQSEAGRPTHMVLGRTEARVLRDSVQFRDLEGTIGSGFTARNSDDRRSLSRVEMVLSEMLSDESPVEVRVGRGYRNTAADGLAETRADIWTGIQFMWDGGMATVDDGSIALMDKRSVLCVGAGMGTGRYERDDGRVSYVWMDERVGETLISANLAYHFSETT